MTGEVRIDTLQGFVHATVEGEIDLANAQTIRGLLEEAVAGDSEGLIVDLRPTRFLDSAGISMLYGILGRLRTNRKGLAIVVPDGSPMHRLMEVTDLASHAVVCASPQDCVEGLRQAAREGA